MESGEKYLKRFDPYRDSSDWVTEDPEEYALRMQSGPLPYWPMELLIEWLFRHNRHAHRYTFLGFENLRFKKVRWLLESIPGREAFHDPHFCDNFENVEQRARYPHDWLANYMLQNGTWNTPIVLLENQNGTISFPNREKLQVPLHLLEGHRRLSFLNGLRKLGKAQPAHDVWLARWIIQNTI